MDEDKLFESIKNLKNAINNNKIELTELNKKIDTLDRRIVDRFTTYDRILASHSRGFKDLRELIENEILTKLNTNSSKEY